MQQEIDEHLAKMDALEKPTMGFHIRGGDKLHEDQQMCATAAGEYVPRLQAPGLCTSWCSACPFADLQGGHAHGDRVKRLLHCILVLLFMASSCVATVCRNRTTTFAEHYIAAFAEEKRRQARRGLPVCDASAGCRPQCCSCLLAVHHVVTSSLL